MFLTLDNTQLIIKWFHKNIGEPNVTSLFDTTFPEEEVINAMILTRFSVRNVHLLLRKPDKTYLFIISNESNKVIETVVNLSNLYPFPTVDYILSEVGRILLHNETAFVDSKLSKDLANDYRFLN